VELSGNTMNITLLVTLLLCIVSIPVSHAKEEPLWELGAGIATFHSPHYLGAEQSQTYVLPTPYFVYRGDIFKADKGGIRGLFYQSDKLDLGISASGALPVNNDDNDARRGMDDLDTQIELGPMIEYQLYKKDGRLLRFDLPVRGSFLLGDEFLRHRGWTTNPRLHFQTEINKWQVVFTAGGVWSDQRYHAYVYDVDSEFVTSDRPFYQSKSGFTAKRFTISSKKRVKDWYFSAALRYYDLNGAANENSPLLKKNDYWSASFVVSKIFRVSKKMAK